MRSAAKVELTEVQREQMETWATGRKMPVRLAERAKMMLLAAQGKTDKEIGADVGVWRGTVARWRGRFINEGLAGIEHDETRPGRKPKISGRKVKTIVVMTTQQRPDDATHWSTRSMAAVVGVKCGERAAHLAGARAQTASGGDVQAVERQTLHREIGSHRRAVS